MACTWLHTYQKWKTSQVAPRLAIAERGKVGCPVPRRTPCPQGAVPGARASRSINSTTRSTAASQSSQNQTEITFLLTHLNQHLKVRDNSRLWRAEADFAADKLRNLFRRTLAMNIGEILWDYTDYRHFDLFYICFISIWVWMEINGKNTCGFRFFLTVHNF